MSRKTKTNSKGESLGGDRERLGKRDQRKGFCERKLGNHLSAEKTKQGRG